MAWVDADFNGRRDIFARPFMHDYPMAEPVIAAAREAGHSLDRLWLCANEDREAAFEWKATEPEVRVVDSTRWSV